MDSRHAVQAFCNRLHDNDPAIKRMHFSLPTSSGSSPLTEVEMDAIARGLHSNTNIEYLCLKYGDKPKNQGITDTPVGFTRSFVVGLFSSHPSLQELELKGSSIRSDVFTVRLISEAMKANTTLKKLVLGIYLQHEGRIALADMLETVLGTNTTLQVLHLYSCGLMNTVCRSLAIALRVNRSLSHLYITNGFITEDGAKELLGAVKSNYYLEVLKMWCCDGVSRELKNRIENTCSNNKRLKKRAKERMEQEIGFISLALLPKTFELAGLCAKPDLLYSALKSRPDMFRERCHHRNQHQRQQRKCKRKRKQPEWLRY